MIAIGVEQTISEGRMEQRSDVDVLGLLEGVSHGGSEAVAADGAPGHDDFKPGPEADSAVTSEVAEGHLDGLCHGVDASGDVAERVLRHSHSVDGQATNLLKTG